MQTHQHHSESWDTAGLPAKPTRATVYEQVTDSILKKMEEGEVPWLKSWSNGLPANASTGKNYRGINILLLGYKDFPSRYWLTFKQMCDEGGHFKEGQGKGKSSVIVFWKNRTEEDIEKLVEKYGEKDYSKRKPYFHAVWNVSQCEGVPTQLNDVQTYANSPIEAAERVVREMPKPPTLLHRSAAIARAGYSVKSDYIGLPPIERFHTAEEYYATLFHEMVHSTAHETRLARPIVGMGEFFGKEEQYSKEELIAELGSSFLCAHCGFGERVIENQAAYLRGWMRWLSNDPKALVEAASAAQKAVDHILGVNFGEG